MLIIKMLKTKMLITKTLIIKMTMLITKVNVQEEWLIVTAA